MKNQAPDSHTALAPTASAVTSKSPLLAGFSFLPHRLMSLGSWFIVAIMALPIAALLIESLNSFIGPADETFQQLAENVLFEYLKNSLFIMIGSVFIASIIALPSAWWCSQYEFVGRRWLQWMMVFPLAIPAYISAYIYTDALDYAGPIQSTLRTIFNWQSPQDYWFFDVRSIWGACLMLALALYPYIYLLLRNTFGQGSQSLAQAAQTMGASRWRIFWSIHFPLARPALAIGCTLVAMESLADYGTVHLFAISTLTTGIYDSWLVYGSLTTAAKISVLTLFFVMALVWLEKNSRKKQQHFDSRNAQNAVEKLTASTQKTIFIWLFCGTVFLLGFVIPVLHLIDYSAHYWQQNWQGPLWQHSQSTFMLAASAAIIATLIALLMNSQNRFQPTSNNQRKVALSSMGYAIPGTVLAIGLLIPFGQFDLWLNRLLVSLGYERIGLILSGTGFALVAAFVIRFAAISNGSLQASYQKMPINLDDASRMLSAGRFKTFRRIHLPLLSPAIVSAFLLVFIECVKELPASLLLRPFDFETLATYVYQFASDEQLEHGAVAALFIIIVSLLPIVLLSRTQKMQ